MSKSGPSPWVVHKFGGSSVADAACFQRVAGILTSQPSHRLAVVLSACRGVTDVLLNLVAAAEKQDPGVTATLAVLRERHAGIAEALLTAEAAKAWVTALDRDLEDLSRILQTTSLMRSAARNVHDLVAGYGELWSTTLFTAYLKTRWSDAAQVKWLDARNVVVADWGPLGPAVQWEASRTLLGQTGAADFTGLLVIPGFVARNPQGVQTTLGRNGSDFSASIFGALLDASEIQIWTDVDGVLSADPRRVPNAQVIDQLSYNEAMELAYFGAKVIHPQTMAPAVGKSIPIHIRNTFAPGNPSTLICAKPSSALTVKGITTIEDVALINIEGAGMIGVPGTAHRLFGALREEGINVVLISQGSSEHSICCAIPGREAAHAERVVRAAFARELDGGQI
ncbi:MAG: Aspartokinase I/homoserine dehydrogenase, partial [Pseudomonadota bacterium]